VQIQTSLFILGKIAAPFPSVFHLNFLQLIRDKSKIRAHRNNKGPPRPNESKPGTREKILLSWGGGYGKCTGEDFFNQLSGLPGKIGAEAGLTRTGGNIHRRIAEILSSQRLITRLC
jgi:hypothetical protein